MSKFPTLLAAVEAREKRMKQVEGSDLWAIGAAVVKECGGTKAFDPSRETYPGTRALVEEAAEELARRGYRTYSNTYLRRLANTAIAYPASRRYEDLSFSIHHEARNPDLLDWAVKKLGGDNVTTETTRNLVAVWDEMQQKKRHEEYEAAAAKAKQADTPRERAQAEQKMKELGRPMPKVNLEAPTRKEEGELVEMIGFLQISKDANMMVITLRKNLAALRKMPVNPDMTDAIADEYATVAEVATQISDLLSKSQKGRFPVVKGGAA